MRPWVDQTNVAHHGEIREVILKCAEEKSAVDRPNPVCLLLDECRALGGASLGEHAYIHVASQCEEQ